MYPNNSQPFYQQQQMYYVPQQQQFSQTGYGPQYQTVPVSQTQGMIPGSNTNPMIGAVVHSSSQPRQGGQPAAVNGFIPPAKPPRRQYIPPPLQPLKFTFRTSNKDAYSRIYAILYTIEILNDEYANGNVDDTFYNQRRKQLKDIFTKSVKAAGFSSSDVRSFADACHLICPLALDFLAPEEKQSKKETKSTLEDAKAIGANYAHFLSVLEIGPFTAENIHRYFISYRILCERLSPDNRSLKSKIVYWNDYFSNKKPQYVMTKDDISKLKNDIQSMYSLISS